MDDLSGISWTSSKPQPNNGSAAQANYYPTLRPTPPASGRSTPASGIGSQQQKANPSIPSAKPATPGNDSFANLVAFSGPQQSSKGLSLQEQQRVIQERKFKQEEEKRRQFDNQFGRAFGAPISASTSGNSTPNLVPLPTTRSFGSHASNSPALSQNFGAFGSSPKSTTNRTGGHDEDEADILAAFNSSAPVDKSSHMPPVSAEVTGASLNAQTTSPRNPPDMSSKFPDDDDDPFGLGTSASAPAKPRATAHVVDNDGDDVLGDLSKPVSEFAKPAQPAAKPSSKPKPPSTNPKDKAMAELIEMGFPPEKAQKALETTDSGHDVQAAVSWLLNQAHADSRKDKQPRTVRRGSSSASNGHRQAERRRSSGSGASRPAWMKDQGRTRPTPSRPDSKSPVNGERDPAQVAQQLGNNFFKTANSLWKTGAKKFNQAVADFNTDANPNQPKWMRDVNGFADSEEAPKQRNPDVQDHDRMRRTNQTSSVSRQPASSVTDEALMLDSGDIRPSRKSRPDTSATSLPGQSFAFKEPDRNVVPTAAPRRKDARAKLTRHVVEEEAAQAYISPARRRRTAKQTEITPAEPDLLFGGSTGQAPSTSMQKIGSKITIPSRPAPQASLPSRPPPPSRTIPPVSPTAISQSTTHRQQGSEAFKRGDYAAATTFYTSGLSLLHPKHPLTVPLLTNRSLSHSKNGDPKSSIADAEAVLSFIGPSRGVGETIDLGGSDGSKPMDVYWGKAQTRLAESLEHLERYAEALTAWRACVEAGVSTATSIAGRNRCENALRPKPTPKPSARKAAPARSRPSALGELSTQSSEAVTRLRVANAAAEKADDERFQLADIVDGKIKSWRNGKEGNLRALLSSLENVLWPEAGWKKVGMGEVIQPNRVKIVYMKGIAKVHPDKLSPTATTEQKMISAAVFATLNEAWERFKGENGM